MYTEYEIRQLPLTLRAYRQRVERFLAENSLRLDDVDYYAGVYAVGDDELLAGGGLKGNVIKCIAVGNRLRDEGMSNRLVSHLISRAHEQGFTTIRVFTKPDNLQIFESLSFRLLATSPKAILMETGDGLKRYCDHLSRSSFLAPRSSKKGVIVMNANPFTRGHRYLIEQAARQVDRLFVMAVKEDLSTFGYEERLAMIQAGCRELNNVSVVEGSDYAISATTFPTYFLKQLSDASDTQMMLDLDLFARHIAPALQASVRFVGSEPTDRLTRRYNELMEQLLPEKGIEVIEIERLLMPSESDEIEQDTAISASAVRRFLNEGSLQKAAALVPPTTLPYLIAHLATQALQIELDTTPKPGLVDKHDNGAHLDMDYALMLESIRALHPYFLKLSLLGFQDQQPDTEQIRTIGIEAEKAMLEATRNVNTHKGALFSLGLAVVAAAQMMKSVRKEEKRGKIPEVTSLQHIIKQLACQFPKAEGTHGSMVIGKHPVKGALANAQQGYAQLATDWLPYYQQLRYDEYQCHKTLLHIMSQLDDTNIYYRKDAMTVARVKQLSEELLADFSVDKLSAMNEQFIDENISPGGSADMLSLTVFIHSILS
ncbi:MAG: [Prevotella sp.]|nr:[citrate (pro-3S)-lyase] ligase [Prevotella sp.]